MCDALTDTGHVDTAYRLLTQRSCPSWLHQVDMGATTVWERWDSMLPDGSVNPGEMTSFNHYALGAVADWMHRTIAGLAPAAPGYRRLLIRPRPGGGLTWARAGHDTPYGRVETGWRVEGTSLAVDLLVPPGVTALVDLPATPPTEVGPGQHSFRGPLPTS
ncbi:alpha-L-rhamnosidase C-terminal domain-containing protein [Streptomyces sp. NPDC001260]|uniref:alpha-L-rhamnosidase-related protein n=1 Tax=Streptomyces sp. NPDC001260 TaxID=3364551 RepID=UPI00367AC2F9